MVHQYWLVSEIYRTAGQTGTVSGTVLTPLIYRDVILNWFLIKEPKKKKRFVVIITQFFIPNIEI